MLKVTALALLLLAGLASRAVADPVIVQSGALEESEDGAYYTVAGTGFDIHGYWLGVLPFADLGPYRTCYPCAPGSTIDVNSQITGSLGQGSATVNGVSYSALSYAGTFTFTAPPVTAPSSASPDRVPYSEPFSFTGQFSAFASGVGTPLFTTSFAGTGLAQFVVAGVSAPSGLNMYVLPGLAYQFSSTASPTPEPMTLWLLGAGLVLVGGRWRRCSAAA